jgi:hypothetical protein
LTGNIERVYGAPISTLRENEERGHVVDKSWWNAEVTVVLPFDTEGEAQAAIDELAYHLMARYPDAVLTCIAREAVGENFADA